MNPDDFHKLLLDPKTGPFLDAALAESRAIDHAVSGGRGMTALQMIADLRHRAHAWRLDEITALRFEEPTLAKQYGRLAAVLEQAANDYELHLHLANPKVQLRIAG